MALLEAADICLLCSHEEGFSNAIFELMAACNPFGFTDVGSNAEPLQQRVKKIVVPAKSPKDLANALSVLIDDVEKRAKFGDASRTIFSQKFGISTCVSHYEDLYANGLTDNFKPKIIGDPT